MSGLDWVKNFFYLENLKLIILRNTQKAREPFWVRLDNLTNSKNSWNIKLYLDLSKMPIFYENLGLIRVWYSEIIQNNKVRLTTNVSTGKFSMEVRWNVYKQALYILVKWIKLNSISRIDFRGILGDVALFRR